MFIINTDTMSRLGNSGQDTNINLIFASEKLVDKIRYTQIDDTWGLDHYPIECVIDIPKSKYSKKTNKKSTKKTKWQDYMTELEKQEATLDMEMYIQLGMQGKYRCIVDRMLSAVEVATYGKRKEKEGKSKAQSQGESNIRNQVVKKGNPVS